MSRIADGFIGGEALKNLEPAPEVAGVDEILEVLTELRAMSTSTLLTSTRSTRTGRFPLHP